MIEVAYEKGDYQALFVGEAVRFLETTDEPQWDLIVATDVLPYMGELENSSRALPRICRQADISAFQARHWTMRDWPDAHSWSVIISALHTHNPMCVRCSTTMIWTACAAKILSFAVNRERRFQDISISRGGADFHAGYMSSKARAAFIMASALRSGSHANFTSDSSIIYLMQSTYVSQGGFQRKVRLADELPFASCVLYRSTVHLPALRR